MALRPTRPARAFSSACRSVLVAAIALRAGAAGADPQAIESPRLSLDRFQPSPGPNRILAIPTARTMTLWSYEVDVAIDYAVKPLATGTGTGVVNRQLTGQLLAAIGFGFVDIGLAVPATLNQGSDPAAAPLLSSPLPGAAMGDVRFSARFQLTPKKWVGALGVEAIAAFPSGDANGFSGEGGYGLTGRLIGDLTLGRMQLAAYLGYKYRTEAGHALGIYVADEVVAGLGASIAVLPRVLTLFLNSYGSFGLRSNPLDGSAPGAEERPLEALLGMHYASALGLTADIAGGIGIGTGRLDSGAALGYGSPEFRFVALLGFCSEYLDNDGDNIPDFRDKCPRRPGPPDREGCPEPPPPPPPPPPMRDADGDKVPDSRDVCPTDFAPPELDVNGDGCRDDMPLPEERATPAETAAQNPAVSQAPAALPPSSDKAVAEPVLFEMNSAALRPGADAALKTLAADLRAHPELGRISIEGHADDDGNERYNDSLSLARAERVRDVLRANEVDAGRMEVYGFGLKRPVVPRSATVGERAINRRVELRTLLMPQSAPTPASPPPPAAAAPSPSTTTAPAEAPAPGTPTTNGGGGAARGPMPAASRS